MAEYNLATSIEDRARFVTYAYEHIMSCFDSGLLDPYDDNSVKANWVRLSSYLDVDDQQAAKNLFLILVKELGGVNREEDDT